MYNSSLCSKTASAVSNPSCTYFIHITSCFSFTLSSDPSAVIPASSISPTAVLFASCYPDTAMCASSVSPAAVSLHFI